MRERTAQSVPIAYLETGPATGEVVVCLHGFPDVPGTWSSFADAATAEGFRVVAPSLPGYAPSSAPEQFDLGAVAAQLLVLCDEMSPTQPLHLVGHDWGAILSYFALRQQPSRFRRAVTMSVPHLRAFLGNALRYPGQLRRSLYILSFQMPDLLTGPLSRDDYALVDRLWRSWSPGFEPPEDHLRSVKETLAQSGDAPLQYYRALRSRSARRMLGGGGAPDGFRINVPTLYLHGDNDGCIGPEIALGQERFFAQGLKTAQVAKAGHFLHLEQPQIVHGHILRWLAE